MRTVEDQLGAGGIDELKMGQSQLRDCGAAWMRREKKTAMILYITWNVNIDEYLTYIFTLNDEWLQLDV